MQALPVLRPHAAHMRIRTPVFCLCWLPHLRWMLYPAGTASVLWLGGNHIASCRGYVKWKEEKRALAQQAPERSRKSSLQANLPLLKLSGPAPTCQADGHGQGVESRRSRGRVVKATTTPLTKPHPNPPPQSVTEVPEKPTVTYTRETAGPLKPELKPTAAPKRISGKA